MNDGFKSLGHSCMQQGAISLTSQGDGIGLFNYSCIDLYPFFNFQSHATLLIDVSGISRVSKENLKSDHIHLRILTEDKKSTQLIYQKSY